MQQIKINSIIKYLIIGSATTVLDLIIFISFYKYFYSSLLISTGIAYVIANIISTVLTQIFIYKNYKAIEIFRIYIKLLFSLILGISISMILIYLLQIEIKLFIEFSEQNFILNKLLVSLIISIYNLAINQFWIFSNEYNLKINYSNVKKHIYHVSVIVPAYNESRRIINTLQCIISYFKNKKFNWEIIVVDDGSTDDMYDMISETFNEINQLKVLRNPENHGKGYSVKMGVFNAHGKYILFTDADNSTPIEEFDKFEDLINENHVLIGSRYKKAENQTIKKQPLYRIFISRIGNLIIRLFLLLDIKDTQCGFKLFPSNIALKIFGLQTIKRFGFDMEILLLTQISRIKIIEIPVNWFDSDYSRFRPVKDTLRTFYDLIKIKLNIWTNFYHNQIKKNT